MKSFVPADTLGPFGTAEKLSFVSMSAAAAEESAEKLAHLPLGLYKPQGKLDHVGFTSGLNAVQRRELKPIVEPFVDSKGFTGKAPDGPSRWSIKTIVGAAIADTKLVCGAKRSFLRESL